MFPVAGGTRRDGYENEADTSVAGEVDGLMERMAWVEKGREGKGNETTGKAQGRPKPGCS